MKTKEFYNAPEVELIEIAMDKAILDVSFSNQGTEKMGVEEEDEF